jgi:capsular polysaccharide biosynthesis protein
MNNENSVSNINEIWLVIYWRVIMKHRKMIGTLVLAAVILTIIISLFMKNIYGAKAIITPIAPKDSGGNSLAASIMQQAGGLPGIGLPDSSSSAEIVTLLKSNILREKIITQYNLLPVLFSDQWDENTKKWKKRDLYNPLTLMSSLICLIKPVDKKGTEKIEGVPDIWDGLRKLDDMVKINNNVKDKTITIVVEFDDPIMAANIAGYFLAVLNDHMSSEAKRVALINRKYLEQQLDQTADPFIKQKVYNLIAQQIETSMMAEVKENFAFKVIDPPKAPDRKMKPNRTEMALISLLASLLIGIAIAFFLGYWEKMKDQDRSKYGG